MREHEMNDGEGLGRWTICGRCHAVRGGPIGTVDGVTVWQRCDCVPEEGLPAQPKIGDFNTALELCRACGARGSARVDPGGRCGSAGPTRRRREVSTSGWVAA